MRRRVCDTVHQVDRGHHDVFVRLLLGLPLGEIPQPLGALGDDQSEQRLFGVCGDVVSTGRVGGYGIGKLLREEHRADSASELTLLAGLADQRPLEVGLAHRDITVQQQVQ